MDIRQFLVFALASLVLNITPGNDMIYVAGRSTGQGIKAGVISSLGIFAGCLVHILAATLGLSSIIAGSASAFTIVKYTGAAYLIYLGIRSFFSKSRNPILNTGVTTKQSSGNIFWQGVLTNVLNPKVALFFLAFLPQFVDIGSSHPQLIILLLGLWFNAGGLLVNVLVAFLFGKMGDWFSKSPGFIRLQGKITGLLLIALGIKVALTSKK
jgi:threonine/homoserine/homoserine lactone efflux protein